MNAHFPISQEYGFCLQIDDFFSSSECETCLQIAQNNGFSLANPDYPTSYRNNQRSVLDSTQIANQILTKLKAIILTNENILFPHNMPTNRIDSINEKIRFCCYHTGEEFVLHQDGVYHKDGQTQSGMSCLIYLNDDTDYIGGETIFFASGPETIVEGDGTPPVIARVRGMKGTLLLFDHNLWHSGARVESGTKFVLRSDLLFTDPQRKKSPRNFSNAHDGYIWAITPLPSNQVASGGRDAVIRLWDQGGVLIRELEGHTRSILGLTSFGEQHLLSVSRDRSLRVWNIESGECELSLTPHSAAILGIHKLEGARYMTYSADKTILIWNDNHQLISRLNGHTDWVWDCCEIHRERIASVSEDGQLKIWDVMTGECLQNIQTHIPLRCIAYQRQSKMLVCGDLKGNLSYWSEGDSGFGLVHKTKPHNAAIRSTIFVDPGLCISCGEDKQVVVGDINTHQFIATQTHTNFVSDLLPLGDSNFLSCSYDGTIQSHKLN